MLNPARNCPSAPPPPVHPPQRQEDGCCSGAAGGWVNGRGAHPEELTDFQVEAAAADDGCDETVAAVILANHVRALPYHLPPSAVTVLPLGEGIGGEQVWRQGKFGSWGVVSHGREG